VANEKKAQVRDIRLKAEVTKIEGGERRFEDEPPFYLTKTDILIMVFMVYHTN
jgi:hypothetical protein